MDGPLGLLTLTGLFGMSRESSNEMPKVIPPPPPPAPPPQCPPQLKSPNAHENCYERVKIDKEKIEDELKNFFATVNSRQEGNDAGFGIEQRRRQKLQVVYSHLQPILQRGPTYDEFYEEIVIDEIVCGIVALSMADFLLKSPGNPDEILERAIRHGYTKKGEMFAAECMRSLAEEIYPECSVKLVDVSMESSGVLVSSILQGGVIIFPYDADFNHSPAPRKGHAAHWAILHGVAAIVTENEMEVSDIVEIFQPGTAPAQVVDNILKSEEEVFLIAHQGKSAHLGVWNVNSCIQSNLNLVEVSPKILSDSESMVLHDMKSGLRGQAVLIMPS